MRPQRWVGAHLNGVKAYVKLDLLAHPGILERLGDAAQGEQRRGEGSKEKISKACPISDWHWIDPLHFLFNPCHTHNGYVQLSSFFRGGHSERLSDFPQVTQLIKDETGI